MSCPEPINLMPTTSPTFFISQDNVLFHIDRKNLEVTTGGFSPAGFQSKGEYIELSESAATLELLFSFVYPSRLSTGHVLPLDKDFETFIGFAEAAEKYEVYYAMHAAREKMRESITSHPIEVMNYASRRGYPELLDAAAPHTIPISLDRIADTMNIAIIPTWLRYYHTWNQVVENTWFPGHWRGSAELCPSYHEAIQNLSVNEWLRAKLMPMSKNGMEHFRNCSHMCHSHAMQYQNELQNAINAVPLFTTFNAK